MGAPMIMRGVPIKAVAYEVGMSERYAYNLAYRIGLRRHFITDEEWNAILHARQQLTQSQQSRPSEA